MKGKGGVSWCGVNGHHCIIEGKREVCGSVRVRGKNPKSVQWDDGVKAGIRRREAAWKEVLAANDEETKEGCLEAYREDERKVKRCVIQSKKKVNEQFGRKMKENVNGNMKLFWKEVSNAKGWKVESCSRIKDANGRLA